MSLTTSTDVVTRELRGKVLLVTIDHAPVNALSADVRRGLLAAIEAADSDPSVQAVLIVGAGRNFIAGADIREFGKPPVPPSLPDVCDRIEACTKPVIAAIHGAALGGGLEVALAAHYRLAVDGAKLGLPEVQLGLLPGAGGTQRTPRLIGAQAALDLMLSGRHANAQEAVALGLVDRLGSSDDILAEGLAYVHELLAGHAPVRRTRDATALNDRTSSLAVVATARAETAKKSRGLFSPLKIVDAVEAAITQPFEDGLRRERQLFLECLDSPQRAGLVHAFFAEREVLKAPETRDTKPRALNAIGVVGGGTMGAGIAVAVLDAGLPVTMIERDEASLARGRAHVEKVYDGLIAKGRMSAEKKAQLMARWTGSTSYDALADADLVIEAVFEDLAVKQAVFAELDRVCKPGAVLATNTSYLDIDAIAASISRPADVIGLHFFSPANIMKLLEVVVPKAVSADVVATAFELAKKLRKTPVRAGVCDGFIGNRILAVYRSAADAMMEDGASPYQIDAAVRAFGFPMGPFQVVDLAGGDIGWAARKRRAATRNPAARYVQIADRLCERGWFGQKTGRGFYLYPEGSRSGQPDPEVEAIIDAERVRAGITPREFSDDEIIRRYMAAMINEGANVVHEQIALRPLDVDVTFLYGYGFPRYRGGPMKYADMIGLRRILADIREFAKEDPLFWRASPLLIDLVERGADFASLNHTA
ncbi:MAG: Enoyl-CoA hydratase (EC / Delta(3)-cis-delta(2)-trans-enoyl-CoA isomerase (EC / 3-hydroxyacyl-CoA dehydrogenase (EC / 3-hydroxybutyryl-CoA epimerase (EC [uncultured Paraburkholderia sp.]|uniref:3-hydroxyacyl-CoA dehydrogenase NAD-binding domain-containing protein n=1 Tax=uncultured Paraburkholderia sp. TaxID=1822466 RepID=UPI002593F020|nr:3-hydroxyacyl-CoA dehydrogenase NAD-binding domain-containing protein [uncultured Paraburkholderia sp.]CAH2893264.1 MAG: Enoyl-CoA hydratase (EC / Delta(3)-cis-delta(2)-trans-enoyl-CoA isomerase (EC / 3-hydroxyacyl-CoA dehydrogenase (EC / 3-hydroxybutyryl-CoA epimerase (EC [uncultured Paraburkholderia sp.]CAH2908587.1 MAG: Enoyl-CoA hydratase (EC / Delta(3)-cis-delta(2)-trans-enoyl-CoA isomerase (EC / 3-hydroxyacyl-CoA dehydrogenase (EC / 3-hydroxybutyryl-CoA epimerase (EC [uncultured Paraburk